jgi:hypothetical protein
MVWKPLLDDASVGGSIQRDVSLFSTLMTLR